MGTELEGILNWLDRDGAVSKETKTLEGLDQEAISTICARCIEKGIVSRIVNLGYFQGENDRLYINPLRIGSVCAFLQWFFEALAPRLSTRELAALLQLSSNELFASLAVLAYMDESAAVICNAGIASLFNRQELRSTLIELLCSKFNIVYHNNDGTPRVRYFNTPFEYLMAQNQGKQAPLLKALGITYENIPDLREPVLHVLQKNGWHIIPQEELLIFLTFCREHHIFSNTQLRSFILESRHTGTIQNKVLSQGLVDLRDELNYELALPSLPELLQALSQEKPSLKFKLFSSSSGKAIHKHWHLAKGLNLSFEETAHVLILYVTRHSKDEQLLADAKNPHHKLGKFLAHRPDFESYFAHVEGVNDLARPH